MAGTAVTATVENLESGAAGTRSEVFELRTSLNKVITDLEVLRAWAAALGTKLDADSGVGDSDYVSGANGQTVNAASDLTANTVNA